RGTGVVGDARGGVEDPADLDPTLAAGRDIGDLAGPGAFIDADVLPGLRREIPAIRHRLAPRHALDGEARVGHRLGDRLLPRPAEILIDAPDLVGPVGYGGDVEPAHPVDRRQQPVADLGRGHVRGDVHLDVAHADHAVGVELEHLGPGPVVDGDGLAVDQVG